MDKGYPALLGFWMNMKKYLRTFLAIVKNNIAREMEFRSHFFVDFLVTVSWISCQLLIIEIYFQFTNSIFGWTKFDMFVLVGVFRIGKTLFDAFPRRNLFNLSNSISRGDIDYALTRPIDSQFLVTLRYLHVNEVVGLFLGGAFLVAGLAGAGIALNLPTFIFVAIGCFFGFLAYYSLMLLAVTISFHSTKLNALPDLHDFISQVIRYPSDVFTRKNFLAEILIFPIVIITTLPTKIILGKLPPVYISIEIFLSLAMFFLARKFWRYSIAKYSSASS